MQLHVESQQDTGALGSDTHTALAHPGTGSMVRASTRGERKKERDSENAELLTCFTAFTLLKFKAKSHLLCPHSNLLYPTGICV